MFQGSLSLGAAAVVAFVWYQDAPLPLHASVLVLGILLATPFGYPYDLVLLALPLGLDGLGGVLLHGWLRLGTGMPIF